MHFHLFYINLIEAVRKASLSLSLTHTHTRTHARTHADTHRTTHLVCLITKEETQLSSANSYSLFVRK